MTSNDRWHKGMYDNWFASETIGSPKFHKLAQWEASFLVNALGLKRGQRILDVPCGTGRHSAVFAAHGLEVTGVDINEPCLALARKACRGKSVTLRTGDMSKLSRYRGQFDAVANLFTSFGYFSTDQKNEQVLQEMISTLKPGGRIALHLVNRDWLLKVFQPTDWRDEKGKFVLEARKYDSATKYNEARMVVVDQKSGKAKVYRHQTRLYSKSEIVAMMSRCGLKDIRVFGNFDGGPYRKFESTHPIYIGRKPLSE